MDRELLLVALLLTIGGPLLWCSSFARPRPIVYASARDAEREAWRALWKPAVPAFLLVAALAGWASHEPEDAELLLDVRLVIAVPVGIVWARTAWRAFSAALRARHTGALAATIGLLRPRVKIDPQLGAALDEDALTAAHAHERAHAQHRDPLRIWLAQIVTDLQWPVPMAHERLRAWLTVLELARDEEAIAGGVDGADLAAAILACARLEGPRRGLVAAMTGDGSALEHRVQRLMAGAVPASARSRGWLAAALVMASILALTLGMLVGEEAVRRFVGAARWSGNPVSAADHAD